MAGLIPFADAAADPAVGLDALALSLAAEFREVDAAAALARLDALAEQLARTRAAGDGTPAEDLDAVRAVLGGSGGFVRDRARYDHPDNSMLDLVLARRRGLPILLSVVYVEVARRAGVALAGVGLPGHFVVGQFGSGPPQLLDPFRGGVPLDAGDAAGFVAPWSPREIAMRMLNNLVAAYQRRGDVAGALRAATMRLALPVSAPERRDVLEAELRAIEARLN